MLTVVHDAESADDYDGGAGGSVLDAIVRDGARQMLEAALRAEVAAYIERFADQLDELPWPTSSSTPHKPAGVPSTHRIWSPSSAPAPFSQRQTAGTIHQHHTGAVDGQS